MVGLPKRRCANAPRRDRRARWVADGRARGGSSRRSRSRDPRGCPRRPSSGETVARDREADHSPRGWATSNRACAPIGSSGNGLWRWGSSTVARRKRLGDKPKIVLAVHAKRAGRLVYHETETFFVPSPKCILRTRLRASRETSAFSRRAMRLHVLSQLGSKKASTLTEQISGQDQALSPLMEYQGSDLFAKNL